MTHSPLAVTREHVFKIFLYFTLKYFRNTCIVMSSAGLNIQPHHNVLPVAEITIYSDEEICH